MAKTTMTVESILEQWLRANGYDGLAAHECGCQLKDFMPCNAPSVDCVPGHSVQTRDGVVVRPGKRKVRQ